MGDMRLPTFLPLLCLLPTLACAPVRGDDDDAIGIVCPDPTCAVEVTAGSIDCGGEPQPQSVVATVQEDGTVDVRHANFTDGCCPEYDIVATLVPDDAQITVDYGMANDFCDCICSLSASFTLVDVPPGSWQLVLPAGGTATIDL